MQSLFEIELKMILLIHIVKKYSLHFVLLEVAKKRQTTSCMDTMSKLTPLYRSGPVLSYTK